MHPAQLVLCIEVAEVFRRFVWIFLRVEWEIIVQAERAASIRDEDSEKLLLPKPVRQGSSNTLMSIAP